MSGCFKLLASGTSVAVPVDPARNLIQHLFLSGQFIGRPLCSGLGRCGLCRIQYVSSPPDANEKDKAVLQDKELKQGWRLACQHFPRQDDLILAPDDSGQLPQAPPVSCSTQACLAIDLGTTAIKWAVQCGEEVLCSGAYPNPQLGAGSDVMSRLAFVGRDAEKRLFLSRLVVDGFKRLARSLGVELSGMTVSGNSAMTTILLNLVVDGLSSAPYRLNYPGDREERIDPELPPVYIPPLLGPFVGADVSSGLVWLQLKRQQTLTYPYLLADLGTNGEFVLALDAQTYLAASVPMGPALEGCGLSHGVMAEEGAVTGFRLERKGVVPEVMGSTALVKGISGTGYLSLLAVLRRAGLLDETGRFVSPGIPLGRGLLDHFTPGPPEARFTVDKGLEISAGDVEELLKIKAAFNSALATLLDHAGLRFSDLSTLYLSGALGEHVDVDDLETLGFIPSGGTEHVLPVGNSSLKGAMLLCDNAKAREAVRHIAKNVSVLNLPEQEGFDRGFIQRMVFAFV